MSVTTKYQRLCEDLERLSIHVENITVRLHDLMDEIDKENTKLINDKLKAEGKLP